MTRQEFEDVLDELVNEHMMQFAYITWREALLSVVFLAIVPHDTWPEELR